MSNYSSAIGDWNAYITGLDSPDSVAYYFRAEALNKLERYKLALDDLDIYVKHHPDDGDGYQQRAIAQANLGDKASAITALRSAAVAYRKEGQDDDATRVERMIADLQAGKAIH